MTSYTGTDWWGQTGMGAVSTKPGVIYPSEKGAWQQKMVPKARVWEFVFFSILP